MRDLPIYFSVEVWLLFVEVDSVVDVSDMIVCVVSLVVLGGDEDVCSVFSDVVVVDNVFVVLSDVVVVGDVFVVLSDVDVVGDVFVVLSVVESTLNVLVVVSAETVILLNDVEFSLEPISSKRLSTESV